MANSTRLMSDELRVKFATTRRELSETLIERDEEIDLVLTALLAQEHVLLVGPPGCGKSLLLDAVLQWMNGRRFSILLNKFTTVEEVFGPVSLAALKEDRYRRITSGRLPEADVCFIDEIWKASSAILNTLLRILNERNFENDGKVVPVPLRLAVAASNEWPSIDNGKELSALMDRFLFRKSVRAITTSLGRQRLLWDRNHTPQLSTSLTTDELDQAYRSVQTLPWSSVAKEAFENILRELAREGILPGDRRQFKTVTAVQAFAFLSGADQVQPEHLEIAQHTLWDDPGEQPRKTAQVILRIANPTGMRIKQLLMEVESVLHATDIRHLAEVAKAAAKLGEIERQLITLSDHPHLDQARGYVRHQLKQLKLAGIEAV